MEQATDLPESAPIVCDNCRAENPATQKFCSSCSYPIGGTLEDRQQFVAHIGRHGLRIKEAKEQIRTAKIIIYVIAAFQFIAGLIVFFQHDDVLTLIVALFMCLLFLIMASWADKNPFPAILTAFLLYVTVILINAVVNPASLFSGIIFKIIFIGAFIKAIRSAQQAQASMKELEKHKVRTGGLR
jgi:hypothetical protein